MVIVTDVFGRMSALALAMIKMSWINVVFVFDLNGL